MVVRGYLLVQEPTGGAYKAWKRRYLCGLTDRAYVTYAHARTHARAQILTSPAATALAQTDSHVVYCSFWLLAHEFQLRFVLLKSSPALTAGTLSDSHTCAGVEYCTVPPSSPISTSTSWDQV